MQNLGYRMWNFVMHVKLFVMPVNFSSLMQLKLKAKLEKVFSKHEKMRHACKILPGMWNMTFSAFFPYSAHAIPFPGLNLIGCIEELHRMRLKTSCVFITNNINPDDYSEISVFKFPFGSVARQSLAKLQNQFMRTSDNWINVAWGRSFVWIFPTEQRTLNECDDCPLCFVLLGSVLQCCLGYYLVLRCTNLFAWCPWCWFSRTAAWV